MRYTVPFSGEELCREQGVSGEVPTHQALCAQQAGTGGKGLLPTESCPTCLLELEHFRFYSYILHAALSTTVPSTYILFNLFELFLDLFFI